MPDVSKIRLPDSTEVNIKDSRIVGVDSAPTSGSSNVVTSGGVFNSLRMDNIRPLETHTYADVLTNSTNVTSGYILFQAKPVVWDEPVMVRYRMRIYVSGHEDLYYSKNECVFAFFHGSLTAYSCKNFIGSTSYKTIYYHSIYRCNAGYEDIGHLIGFCYYNAGDSYSRNCTTSGYGRTFIVEILETDNCTITWPETCGLASAITGFVSGTSHSTKGDYNGYGQGETHTGDANSNTVGYFIRYSGMSLPVDDRTYRYRILFSSKDRAKWIPSNTSTSTNATALRDVNQTPIDPFGPIVYYSTTTALAANGVPGVSNIWTQYALTLGYSFNRTGAALVLTFPAPVYLKCAPQTDGTAIIDATTPYVQALPSSNDGKIYIYLGNAYSDVAIELIYEHLVFYHDGTGIRIWTGSPASSPVTEQTITNWGFTKNALLGVSFNGDAASVSNGIAYINKTIPNAPGTLVTNNTEPQTASQNESLSSTVNLHKISKTGTYSDLVGKPTIDSSPSENSSNLVSSGGVYSAIASVISQIVSFDTITSQQDGTIDITLSNGDVITIDLNHVHQQYPKYVHLTDESGMPASPESDTMYLIDGSGGGSGSYVLPAATSAALGGVKIGYTQSGRNYPLLLDGSNNAYVTLPYNIVYLTSESQMPASPDANTLYLILESNA